MLNAPKERDAVMNARWLADTANSEQGRALLRVEDARVVGVAALPPLARARVERDAARLRVEVA